MTTTMRREAAAVVDPTSWSSPDENLWVASNLGEFAGMVEFRDGHFVAGDRTGNTLGNFSSIPAAREAVDVSITTSNSRIAALAPRFIRPGGIAGALLPRSGGTAA
jgi:hypothetical protein